MKNISAAQKDLGYARQAINDLENAQVLSNLQKTIIREGLLFQKNLS